MIFFVCSRDIGVYLYAYNEDANDWSEFYVVKSVHGGIEEFVVKEAGSSLAASGKKEWIYDADCVPDEVWGFVRNQ